jgi:protein N-lysine methyltransferase METTL21A
MNQPHSSDPEWLDLKSEIERAVTLESTQIELGNQWFTWYRVTNTDQLLQAALESDGPPEEVDPFWAATWRAAQGLDRFLNRFDLAGVQVLELGCGSGQAGTGAAARGAQVTMTDAVDLALKVAKLNSWPVAHRIDFRKLRWNVDRIAEPAFPIIIGSDLVYDPNIFSLLEACARQHLAAGGKLLLSEPHRHTGDKFSSWIVQAGWRKLEHDVDMNDDRVPIRVFECWLD